MLCGCLPLPVVDPLVCQVVECFLGHLACSLLLPQHCQHAVLVGLHGVLHHGRDDLQVLVLLSSHGLSHLCYCLTLLCGHGIYCRFQDASKGLAH